MSDDHIGVTDQDLQQLIFDSRQMHFLAGNRYFAPGKIDIDLADAKDGIHSLGQDGAGSTKGNAQPGEQLANSKRLIYEIVCAGVQRRNLVL